MILLSLLIIYIALIVLSFYFSGSETGFLGLNLERYEQDLQEARSKRLSLNLEALWPMLNNMELVLGVTLFGNNLVNIAAVYVGETLWLGITGSSSLWIYTVVSAGIFLVFAEVLPKTLFKKKANVILYRIGPSLLFFHKVFSPFVFLITKISSFLIHPLVSWRKKEKLSKKDIDLLLDEAIQDELIKHDEKALLARIASLSHTKVADIMKPLVDLHFVRKEQDLMNMFREISRSKIDYLAVYEDRVDNVIGLVDCLSLLTSTKKKKVAKEIMQDVLYYPETNTLDKLYFLFSQNPVRSVVVVDEYGGCSGMVHERDVIGYLFGFKSYPISKDSHLSPIKKISAHEYHIEGICDLSILNKQLNVSFPQTSHKTLGGYVNALFGYIPQEGEIFETKPYTLRILKASKTMVDKVALELHL